MQAPKLPSALEHAGELARGPRRPALFLDYDGTLSPIVERPELAVLPRETREVLRRLDGRLPLAVVSGRDLQDVRGRVGLRRLAYAGSHGFDILTADGRRLEHPDALAALPDLEAAAGALRRGTADIAGAQIEHKRFSVAIHYRRVAPGDVPAVERAAEAARAGHPRLRMKSGKKVFELQPDVEWDKGRAVLWLLDALGLADESTIPVYIGDDTTDEDAFRVLEGRGMGIVVMDEPRGTAARWALGDPAEVREFLSRLAAGL